MSNVVYIADIKRTPPGEIAYRAAKQMRQDEALSVTINKNGRVYVEPVERAQVHQIIGVYQGEGKFSLERDILADIQHEIKLRRSNNA